MCIKLQFGSLTTLAPIKKRSYSLADYEKLNALILEYPFTGVCWSNPNVLLKNWYQWLSPLLDMAVPYKTRHRCNLPPWVSPQTSHSMKKLETLRRKYFSKPNDNIQLKITILEKSIESSTEIDQANYETSLANRRNTSHLFKYFKSLRKSNPIPSSVNWGSVTAKTEFEQCHLFNEYFISVFSTDTGQFIEDRTHEIKIQDIDASERKFIQILKQLDITKSRGDDELPPVLFRNSNI